MNKTVFFDVAAAFFGLTTYPALATEFTAADQQRAA